MEFRALGIEKVLLLMMQSRLPPRGKSREVRRGSSREVVLLDFNGLLARLVRLTHFEVGCVFCLVFRLADTARLFKSSKSLRTHE